jgi:hypothetical protein
MIPLVEIPEIVRHYAPHFQAVFTPEQWVQFQRYLSGLIVSDNKTVDGINRLFVVDLNDQSTLNRFLTEGKWSVEALQRERLQLLASHPATQMKRGGVLSVDDTLLEHFGQEFEAIAYLKDPSRNCYVWAHNLVNLHYSDERTDYPVEFRLWKPAGVEVLEAGLRGAGVRLKESKQGWKERDPKQWRNYLLGVWRRHQDRPEVAALYESKRVLAQQMVDPWAERARAMRWPITYDRWYTQPAFCRHLSQGLGLNYVGTLVGSDCWQTPQGAEEPLSEWAQRLKSEHQQALKEGQPPVFTRTPIHYKGEEEHYWTYSRTCRIPHFGKQRLVISYQREDWVDDPHFFISNNLKWQAGGIVSIRRHRWPVEVYHEEGKAEGLDPYQVRGVQAIVRHIALVALTYSLLRLAPHDASLQQALQQQLETGFEGTAGAWRRATQVQALWSFGAFVADGLEQGQTFSEVMSPVVKALLR